MANTVLYIAIDFGTSYSGYAISFKTKQPQESIQIPNWGVNFGYNTFKTPTCILFDEHETFQKFGYDAMMTYTRSTPKSQARKSYLFEHFKMELYDKEIHRDLMITAKNGGQMKALTVFSESLRYLKDHALDKINENTTGKTFIASDVTWVLTVPAIWNAAAKQFMREAAIKADLVIESEPERLVFALEPEAASIYCKQLPSEGYIAEEACQDTLEQKPGTQYMVVDCGGGTIDITVHEVVEDGNLKELHAASGNDMGGQTVDRKFISFLKEIFSEKIYNKFAQEFPSEALKLKYDIALAKSCDELVLIQCPVSLQDLAKKEKTIESYFEGVEGAEWDEGSIIIKEDKLQSFFDESLKATAEKLEEIMSNPELNIEFMLLVGGFAECKILKKFLKEHFNKCKIICPVEPQVVIIKGAIRYAKQPKVVKSRVSALTYGIRIDAPFDEVLHNCKSSYVNSVGQAYCDVCFETFVRKGDSVNCDEVRQFFFNPSDTHQTSATFQFFSTDKKQPQFIDELGVEPVGFFTVGMPKTDGGLSREIKLEIKFGSTEMKATATDVDSGVTTSVKLDFINN
ncbi:heat shock protein family A (Hsp70) member 12A.3 [Danio aesculapii]|uniref:heat shock protein family A (Hsp70) member 12A.3 n=1 Tax=Danio aesculapii TaxID=1142201 RepID=UPI0024BFEE4E|nr:heat shock protein family A (Hsp70) member 12A.3 [Danio aesculapii]